MIHLKHFLKICYVEVCKFVVVLFFSTFLIVPGVASFLDLAYSPLIAKRCPELDLRGVFGLSRELSKGMHRKIFLALMFSILSVCLSLVAAFCMLKICSLFIQTTSLTFKIGTICCGFCALLFFALPYYFDKIKASFLISQSKKVAKM